jgi:type I restriction enzyme, R subunit
VRFGQQRSENHRDAVQSCEQSVRGTTARWSHGRVRLVEQLNDRFGTDFTDADKLLFDQFEAEWVADGELSDQARSNTLENFALAFERKFMSTIVTRMDANSEIFKKILDDDEFSDFVRGVYLKKVYEHLREAA